ncbi:hypothetical protein DUI87_35540 [Hirundo rustica rustica]|uniref:Uncharacterized protein n=1 Tax=Hirundo rustica rustica TaxID=333673 RepID=A0A3M0IM91_HIRRU|nr:hypothetical protein DUI87_35540 [Hirundo rustica rustica]
MVVSLLEGAPLGVPDARCDCCGFTVPPLDDDDMWQLASAGSRYYMDLIFLPLPLTKEDGIESKEDGIECLWVRMKGKANKADILLGVCYCPPNQEEEVDNLFYKQLDEEKAEVLNAYFASVFSEETTCLQDNCPPGLVDGVREQNGPLIIQEEAVRELLTCLDIHKSMRPDRIHPRVMRELADELAKPLSIIYHQSWFTGEVPDDWKLANVTPIHKKGAKEDPGTLSPTPVCKGLDWAGPARLIDPRVLTIQVAFAKFTSQFLKVPPLSAFRVVLSNPLHRSTFLAAGA